MTLYEILGVTDNATNAEIRDAYRKLAKEYHPDRFKGRDDPFKEIKEAYEILKDDNRRREYNNSLRNRYYNKTPQFDPFVNNTDLNSKDTDNENNEVKLTLSTKWLIWLIIILVGIYVFLNISNDNFQENNKQPAHKVSIHSNPSIETNNANLIQSVSPTHTPTSIPEWREILIISGGNGDSTSDKFTVRGSKWRVDYSSKDQEGYGFNSLDITIIPTNERITANSGMSQNSYIVHSGSGSYFFRINSYKSNYTIKIYDYY